jgi:Uma2 family endonuclease
MPLTPNVLLRLKYEKWAEEYLKSLPLEHFMEATAQSKQREITIESFALVRRKRAEFQYFNELLIQYPKKRQQRPGRVVPDNMVVLHPEPIVANGSYDLPLQPVGPFWTLEYVSKSSERKDYEANYAIYERELKVPYYLAFYPEPQELSLFHLHRGKYVSVTPSLTGRYAIPEVELEVAILGGWARFWYEGRLLALPGDLEDDLVQTQARLQQEKQRADSEGLRANNEQLRADTEKQRADTEKQRADDLTQQVAEMARRIAELEGRAGNGKKKK